MSSLFFGPLIFFIEVNALAKPSRQRLAVEYSYKKMILFSHEAMPCSLSCTSFDPLPSALQ